MALVDINTTKVILKRFPPDVRKELNDVVERGWWKAMASEFSVDRFNGVKFEALDSIPDLVDSSWKGLREHVRMRINTLKELGLGDVQALKGKSIVGLDIYFYRYT